MDRLVGRTAELELLDGMARDVQPGGFGVVTVVGEPGIGKSRLAIESAARCRAAGFQVFSGRGSELEQEAPFGLIVDALDRSWDLLDEETVAAWDSERRHEMAKVFPSITPMSNHYPSASALDVERFRCHFAVRQLLTDLTSTRPVLLLLDDVHWADTASMELIAHLIRRGVDGLMIMLTYRSTAPMSTTVMGRVLQEADVEVIELGPLSAADLATSVGEASVTPRVAALYVESGGNPFYFTELARSEPHAPQASDKLYEPSGVPQTVDVPAAVLRAIGQELRSVSRNACLLAQAGAVVGEPFIVDFAGTVTELAPDELLGAADELVASGIVQVTDVPGQLTFRHPIVRRAVYDDCGYGWRLGAHRRAAAALAGQSQALNARAHHMERGASPGDMEAVEILAAAGRAALSRAPSAAARWYAGAARLLPTSATVDQQLEIMLPLATSLATVGRTHESRDVLDRARELVGTDRSARQRVTILLANAEHGLGHSERVRRLLNAELADADPGSVDAVRLTLELATNHVNMGEWADAVRVATQTAAAATELGDRALVASATVISGLALLYSGNDTHDEARRFMRAAATMFDELPDDELAHTHLVSLSTLAFAESVLRHWSEGRRHTTRGLRLCRASGRGEAYLPLMLAMQSITTICGQLADAETASEMAVEAATLAGNDQWQIATLAMQCRMYTMQGDLAAAMTTGRRAVKIVERAPNSMFAWLAYVCLGLALFESGDHVRGRQELFRAGGPSLSKVPPISRPHWEEHLVESYITTGDLQVAAEIIERMERPDRVQVAEVKYARANLLMATGDHAAAAATAGLAAMEHETNGMQIDAARAWLLTGRAHIAAGDTPAGIDALNWAHTKFSTSGAARGRARAAQELRALGQRVSPRPTRRGSATGEALTDREIAISDRVADGQTNRRIAEDLFISPKTVESHLARIYGKLGIGSRTALAAHVARARGVNDAS